MDKQVGMVFGEKLRVRCMAIIEHEGKILLINHSGLNSKNCFWMPPGGGVEPYESIIECIEREVYEETGLEVLGNTFMYLHEHVDKSLHAVEIIFKSKVENHNARLGYDPELADDKQLMNKLRWVSYEEILEMNDQVIHPIIKKYVTC